MGSLVRSRLCSKELFFYAVTPLHPGMGRAESIVDLPVQRDAYGLPVVYSSSLKGALRGLFRRVYPDTQYYRDLEDRIFGSGDRIGGVNILDSHLLIFPARSLKGIVIGVTTPFLLNRYQLASRDLGTRCLLSYDPSQLRISTEEAILITKDGANQNEFTVPSKLRRRGGGGSSHNELLYINEIAFEKSSSNVPNLIADFIRRILNLGVLPYRGVAIVHDDWLRPLLNKSMEYRTRVRLDPDTKRPVSTGLWTVEAIPPGTVFVTFLTQSVSGDKDFSKYAQCIERLMDIGVFIGGEETVGMGLIKRMVCRW